MAPKAKPQPKSAPKKAPQPTHHGMMPPGMVPGMTGGMMPFPVQPQPNKAQKTATVVVAIASVVVAVPGVMYAWFEVVVAELLFSCLRINESGFAAA